MPSRTDVFLHDARGCVASSSNFFPAPLRTTTRHHVARAFLPYVYSYFRARHEGLSPPRRLNKSRIIVRGLLGRTRLLSKRTFARARRYYRRVITADALSIYDRANRCKLSGLSEDVASRCVTKSPPPSSRVPLLPPSPLPSSTTSPPPGDDDWSWTAT